jgi:SAM-dependent methyltransferase
MSIFKSYSKYYDLLYKDKNYKSEADYIANIIKENAPNAKTVLDLGCGTGIHDYLLAKKGYYVDGIDFSEEMIAKANSKFETNYKDCKSLLNFEVGDIRTWQSDKKYDVVISLFHVMSYQITNEDIQNAVATMKNHLNEKGIIIFDFWYGPGVLSDPPATRIKRLHENQMEITRIAEPIMYPNENCVDVNYTILFHNKIDNSFNELKETHKMRYLFLPEIENFLNSAGLKLILAKDWKNEDVLGFKTWNAFVLVRVQ